MIPDSVRWSFFRRKRYSKILPGFKAHFLTYASPDCTFDEYVSLQRNSQLFSCRLGRATYVAGASLSNVTVGKFCSIGQGVRIGLANHPTDFLSTHPALYSSGPQTMLKIAAVPMFSELTAVALGNDVWIGANSLIMGGVSIGDGVIIGAGSVVTKDIPAYAVAVGSPAKVIRYRFDEQTISDLLRLKWWDRADQEIERIAQVVSPHGPIAPNELKRFVDTPLP